MPRTSATAPSLDRVAKAAIDELLLQDFATGAQLTVMAGLAASPSGPLATALLKAFGVAASHASLTAREFTVFAGFLILATSADHAHAAMAAAFDGTAEHLFLADQLGLPLAGNAPAETVSAFVGKMTPNMAAIISADPQGPVALNQTLLELPAVLRAPLIAAMLQEGRTTKAKTAFAALALLFPFDGATKRHALDWLVAKGGDDASAFLAGVPGNAVDKTTKALISKAKKGMGPLTAAPAKDLPCVPIHWPVVDAFATPVDGQGSQGLYLVRQISARRVALIGAVCNDVRGLADGLNLPSTSLGDLREMVDALSEDGVDLVPVPAEYVIQRVQAGIEQARARQLPLPMAVQAGLYLLAGVPAAEPVDVMAAAGEWADAAMLPETHFILHTRACSAWYFTEEDGVSAKFFAAADKAMAKLAPQQHELQVPLAISQEADEPDGLLLWLHLEGFLAKEVAAEVDRLFTAERRRRWSQRLAEMAFWFDQDGRGTMGDLAATAAVALAPESGVALADQPLLAAMLRLSAVYHTQV
jgi:hypothetical protein